MAISAGYTCDIDRPLCMALKQHKGRTLFTQNREKIKPGGFQFGHNNFCNDCLHETPTKIAQTGLKTSRTDYVHIGTKSERNECCQILIQIYVVVLWSFYSSAKTGKPIILKIVLLILREKERRRHSNMVTFTGKNHK